MESQAERVKKRVKRYKPQLSGRKCKGCTTEITERQLEHSMRVYKKPLCFGCQRMDKPVNN